MDKDTKGCILSGAVCVLWLFLLYLFTCLFCWCFFIEFRPRYWVGVAIAWYIVKSLLNEIGGNHVRG